jgi:PKD repeat protein
MKAINFFNNQINSKMKRIFLILTTALCLCVGNKAMGQTATVIGDFYQGLRCVGGGQSAMFEFVNNSTNKGDITAIKWEIKDKATDSIINTNTDLTNKETYIFPFSQPGTFRTVMTVTWNFVVEKDSMEVVIHSRSEFSFVRYSDSVCPGEGVPFSYTMTPPFTQGMVQSVEWLFGDGGHSIEHAPIYHYSNSMNIDTSYTVRLTITDTNLCATTIDSTNYIFVRRKPLAAFTDNGHEFPCPNTPEGTKGRTISFSADSSQGLSNPDGILKWNFGDTTSGVANIIIGSWNNSTARNPVHTYNNAGKYDVLLIVQDNNRCIDSVWMKEYVVILGPKGSFSYEEGPSYCKPLEVFFTPSISTDPEYQPDSLIIYAGTGEPLTNKGDYTGLTRSRRFVYIEKGTYTPVYFLYKTVVFGGKQEQCIVEIREPDTIYVVVLETDFETEILYSSDSVTTVRFNNTSTWTPDYLGGTSVIVTWDMGNGDSSQTTFHGQTVYDTAGTYRVKLTMQVLNCVREKTTDVTVVDISDLVHVTVSANDSVMGTVTGSGYYPKNTIVSIISAMPNFGYRFVQWNDGDITNPRTIIATQDTIFTAIFEATTGITDLETSTISIYSNPTRDNIHIVLPENISNAVFTLYDMQGRTLIRQNIGNEETVSVSNLATGMYIYNIRTNKEDYQGKIIKK